MDTERHPDLFWAIRGGGGNFGVATRLQFRLHEVDTIVGGMLLLPATPEVIASFVAAAEAAPEELSTIANVMTAPPVPFLPPEAHGELRDPAVDTKPHTDLVRALLLPELWRVRPLPSVSRSAITTGMAAIPAAPVVRSEASYWFTTTATSAHSTATE